MRARIGYYIDGREFMLDESETREGITILSKKHDVVSQSIFLSMTNHGWNAFYFDLTFNAYNKISGYVKTVDSPSLISDAIKVDEKEPELHCEIFCSLLSNILSLPESQRLILLSSLLAIAKERGYITPVAIFDVIDVVEGFKAQDKEDLEGKIASFGNVEIISGNESISSSGPMLVSFSSLRSTHSALFTASLIISKFCVQHFNRKDEVLFLPGIARLIPARKERNKMFEEFLSRCVFGKVFSDIASNDPLVTELKITESDIAGSFVLRGKDSESDDFFILAYDDSVLYEEKARRIEDSAKLRYEILNAISSSNFATRQSIIAWLSASYEKERIAIEIDRLASERYVALFKPSEKSKILALRLTALGESELRRIKNEQDKDRN